MADTTIGTSVAIATPDLKIIDGQITTTSQQVAEHFGKRHDRVLRAIQNLLAELPEDAHPNFGVSEYTDSTGRTLPAYRMTRDGFTLLAMGFTGKEALQWKLAYLSAFNHMEAQLLAQATAPQAGPAIAYDRISPAQKQDLKEIVDAIVAAKVQTYGETWARLQRKFRVNKYEELPATRHLEARAYLLAKLPRPGHLADNDPALKSMIDQWMHIFNSDDAPAPAPTPAPAAPAAPIADAEHIQTAFEAAAQAGAAVQAQVFSTLMQGDPGAQAPQRLHYMLSLDLHPGQRAHPQIDVQTLAQEVDPISLDTFIDSIAQGDCAIPTAQLLALSHACNHCAHLRLQGSGGTGAQALAA